MHCVDLGESFPTHIYLQKSASIQPRTSPVKFARSPCTDPPGCDIRGQEEGETYLPVADDSGRAEPGAQQKAQVVFFRNFGITTSHNGVVLRRFSILLCETSENLCQPSAGVAEVVMPSC